MMLNKVWLCCFVINYKSGFMMIASMSHNASVTLLKKYYD